MPPTTPSWTTRFRARRRDQRFLGAGAGLGTALAPDKVAPVLVELKRAWKLTARGATILGTGVATRATLAAGSLDKQVRASEQLPGQHTKVRSRVRRKTEMGRSEVM